MALASTEDVFASIESDLMDDCEEGMTAFARQWPDRIREVFEREGTRGSEAAASVWKPTTAVALRNRKNPVMDPSDSNWRTLVDTGNLRASITHEVARGKKGIITGQAYSEVPYAKDMQEGSTYQGRPVPARPFLFGVEPDDSEALISELERSIKG